MVMWNKSLYIRSTTWKENTGLQMLLTIRSNYKSKWKLESRFVKIWKSSKRVDPAIFSIHKVQKSCWWSLLSHCPKRKENEDVKDPTNYNKKISRYGQNERTKWWLDKQISYLCIFTSSFSRAIRLLDFFNCSRVLNEWIKQIPTH